MKRLIYILSISYLLTSCFQSFDNCSINGTYLGYWAETDWKFIFYHDNTFKRISEGHYGRTTVEGKYKINSDTIEITEGTEGTDGTVNKFYLIEGDSCIIDVELRYDYCRQEFIRKETFEIEGEVIEVLKASRVRNIKYQQIPATDIEPIFQLENAINDILNLDTLQEGITCLGDSLYITNYFEVNEKNMSFNWAGRKFIFKNKDELQGLKYVEIEDINLNEEKAFLNINFWCDKKWKSIIVELFKENKKWEIDFLNMTPNW